MRTPRLCDRPIVFPKMRPHLKHPDPIDPIGEKIEVTETDKTDEPIASDKDMMHVWGGG